MDHEVVMCSSKICDWPLNLSLGYIGLHQENRNVRVTMELEVQKRPIVKPTSSTIMVRHVLRWEREIRFSCCKYQEPWQRNALFVYLLYFIAKSSHIYEERREEEGEKVKHENNL